MRKRRQISEGSGTPRRESAIRVLSEFWPSSCLIACPWSLRVGKSCFWFCFFFSLADKFDASFHVQRKLFSFCFCKQKGHITRLYIHNKVTRKNVYAVLSIRKGNNLEFDVALNDLKGIRELSIQSEYTYIKCAS